MKKLLLLSCFLIPAISALFFLFPADLSVSNNATGHPIPVTSVSTKEARIGLTFDVLSSMDELTDIVQVLQENQITATFFLTSQWAEKHPRELQVLIDARQDLQFQGPAYNYLHTLSASDLEAELSESLNTFIHLTGSKPSFFRPPYGSYSDSLFQWADRHDLTCISWSLDSQDWKDLDSAALTQIVLEHPNLKKGAVLRFHTNSKYLCEALRQLIPRLYQLHCYPVPLTELLLREDYCLDEEGTQHSIKPLLS